MGELNLLCKRVWLSGQLLERLFEAFLGLEFCSRRARGKAAGHDRMSCCGQKVGIPRTPAALMSKERCNNNKGEAPVLGLSGVTLDELELLAWI